MQKGVKTIERIKEKRLELGLSQEQFANKIGVTQGAISMIENGERTPSLEMITKIATALNCTIDELIERTEVKG